MSYLGDSVRKPATKAQTHRVLMAPIKIVVSYLLFTYALFTIGPLWSEVDNKIGLSILVIGSYAALYSGFYLCTISHLSSLKRKEVPDVKFGRLGKLVFAAGSIYFTVWGLNQILEFGILSPGDLLARILSPGEAYAAKFDIFEMRIETQRVSRITQLLLLTSIFFALYIPVTVVSWSKIKLIRKAVFCFCISVFALSYLAIGTLKGFGDLFIIFLASAAILIGRRALRALPVQQKRIAKKRNRRVVATILLLLTAVSGYMIVSQKNRVAQFGIEYVRTVGDIDQSPITQLVGREWAMGIFITISYPTHGYAGLSFALNEPFVFSGGAGIAPAYESYRYQNFGGERQDLLTYPARAEYYSGWTNGMFWSTAIALIASDTTFYGVPFLFLLIGYAFSRTWITCLYTNSYLGFAILPLFFIFSFFIPANNQVLAQRQGFLIVLSLLFIALFKAVAPRKRKRR